MYWCAAATCACSLALLIREKHVENQINKLTQQAKERKKKGDKKGALFCLKKRKLLQGQIDKLQAARLNLETMQLTIGSAKYVEADVSCSMWWCRVVVRCAHGLPATEICSRSMNREILTGMQTGAAALGQIHQNMYVPSARAVVGGELG